MTKLIYIISTGHSGSTLLDILIGTFPNVFSTGEFRYLTWLLYSTQNGAGSVEKENVCTCGKRFQECEMWSKIISKTEEDEKIDIFNNPSTYKTTLLSDFKDKGKSPLLISIIRKLVSFEMFFLKNSFFSKCFKKLYVTELKNIWKLIDTIGEVTNSDYVVDSSKNMLRYYLLKKERPEDVFLIINYRDNFGFANSYIKRNILPEKSLKKKNRYIFKTNKLIKNLEPNYMKTKYEDFVKEPDILLRKISNHLDIKYESKQIEEINTKNYHLVAGNPMRFRGKLNIIYDDSWNQQLSEELKSDIKYYINKYKLNLE